MIGEMDGSTGSDQDESSPRFFSVTFVRILVAICGLLALIGLGIGAHNGRGGAGVVAGSHHAAKQQDTSSSVPSTPTTSTLSDCGSVRDPFDPTRAPPPAGSPAIC